MNTALDRRALLSIYHTLLLNQQHLRADLRQFEQFRNVLVVEANAAVRRAAAYLPSVVGSVDQ